MNDPDAVPPFVTISLHRSDEDKAGGLTCCCAPSRQHAGATLLVTVGTRWRGAAACIDHLGEVIERALEDASVALIDPRHAASGPKEDAWR